MLNQSTIDQVISLDIIDVIGRHVQLTRRGTNHIGSCPFHQEKTPSFMVSHSKGIFRCFGCGKSGNGVRFFMELKRMDFIQAVRTMAADHNIEIVEDSNPEHDARYKHFDALYVANDLIAAWFMNNLANDEKASKYVYSRWNKDSITDFRIGYAPDSWDALKKFASEKGIRQEILTELGLLSESKGKVFDTFRNRIMFPILNRQGRVTGFIGRDFSGKSDTAKYMNSKESEIYSKSRMLYGFNQAYRAIREQKYAILVEGNPDVIRMHQIGKFNAVGTCGTSLTREHIEEIKRFCDSVTIIGDADKAGQAAVMRSGKLIIESGLFCQVIPLPMDQDQKHDPDSFFTDDGQYDEYAKENIEDYIIWLARTRQNKAKSPDLKTKLIDELSELITHLPKSSHAVYIEQLGSIIKPKKAWQDRIKSLIAEEPETEEKASPIPDHILLSDFEKYGFYADGNQYYFKTREGVKRGCNFVMDPLFHIESVMNAKRLYKITNEYGFSRVIELPQKDLISLANFRLRVESLGNFLFEGSESDLSKLKRYLYEKTQSCLEITQLGWQKHGFWAWCNGIYNGKFSATDFNGIVQHDGQSFYLPASSEIYKGEETLFISERRFRFIEGEISLYDYSRNLMNVFGDNAIFGICFYLATLFRDHIVKLFGFFPILNLFGPKGAGKTELAISLMQFFGAQSKGPNITNTTNAALADHVALFSNSCCHIDEYKNNLEYEKIEFLKGLWDGTGRTRMNMDKDKKKETTHVDCGIILSGQEMPTADIALFSRLIFLSFNKVEYTEEEKVSFNHLKQLEKHGISHITHEILTLRKIFIAEFIDNYRAAAEELANAMEGQVIEDRIFRNWLVIISAYRTLHKHIEVPWAYSKMIDKAARLILNQNKETKKSNELSTFWGIVEYLAMDGKIREEVDFKVDYVDRIKTDKLKEVQWSESKNVLYIDHSKIFPLYRIHGRQANENILPTKTLEYYLVNSKEYLGRKASVSFKVMENNRVVEDADIAVGPTGGEMKRQRRHVTTAMAFNYDDLGISIHNVTENVDVTNQTSETGGYLPF